MSCVCGVCAYVCVCACARALCASVLVKKVLWGYAGETAGILWIPALCLSHLGLTRQPR